MTLVRMSPERRETADLSVTTLEGPVSPLDKVGIAVNESVTRQGSRTIVTKGIIFGMVSLPDTE